MSLDFSGKFPFLWNVKNTEGAIATGEAPQAQKPPSKTLTHNEAILYCLTSKKGQWVSLTELSEYTAQVCGSRCYPIATRVSNLRLKGHDIANRTEQVDGVTKSWYKLGLPPNSQ